ncbi:E3 ubiquitin ligase SCF complex, Skp subunit [Hypoxylon sp. NC0597]|nr:E3 ubiquitin ligase SCF complex, Skp subunit [Hypoxylon sp. NC0597]
MASTYLTLQAEDGQCLTISREAAKKSQLFTDLMEDLAEEETELPIPIQADKETLEKVVQWCQIQVQHEDEEAKRTAKEANEEANDKDVVDASASSTDSDPDGPYVTPADHAITVIPSWAKGFFAELSRDETFAVITAANFLDIPLLLEYSAKHIANNIKGMSTEQMREFFNIENDFSPEEEERIRRECEWAMPDKYDDFKH